MSTSLPRVSLLTITHNRPRLLELLAGSVIAQSYPPELLEWVVIDDSTSPGEPDLSSVPEAGIALVYERLPQRLPIGAKRNLCHARAHGEVLVLMDDDDYYPPSRVAAAVAALESGHEEVAGCVRMPLLLLPEGSRWLTPCFCAGDATANSLAYRRSYIEAGHGFDPHAEQAEEMAFLDQFTVPLVPLDPAASLTCIGHGGNTVDKRLWIARNGQHRFERLPEDAPGFPPADYLRRYCDALGLPAWASPVTPQLTPPQGSEDHWKVAVITPYCTEPLAVLRRCHSTVMAQSVACTHVLVADGPGHPELADWNCRHIVLGASHGDNGNTPRSIGALAAMNEGFTCIAFLDADNWWTPEHLRAAIATQAQGSYEVVFSDRSIVFPQGLRLTQAPLEDRTHRHADTSCMVLFEPAFSNLALWAQMPALLAPQCDRVMFAQLMARQSCGWSHQPTVVFETWYAAHFLAAGLLPPRNAKFPRLHPPSVWQKAAAAFRLRSPTPLYPGGDGVGHDKPRINLVSILGPARSGGTLLQAGLCSHLGFEGIPEHHMLFHCVAQLGPDPRLRHEGARIMALLASVLPPDPRLKAHDRALRGLEKALRPDRSYTLLEVYFKMVQALTPAAVMEFSKAYGQVTLLDRSCSHSLVADVLFQCLPEHRAVLLLRDPLEQITSVRRMQALHPSAWHHDDSGLANLCRVYLLSLTLPLQAAPSAQLLPVSWRRLTQQTEAVVAEVSAFLGLEPNPFLALEPLELPPGQEANPVHEQALQAELAALPRQLLHNEPWKLECLPSTAGRTPAAVAPAGLAARLSAEEAQALAGLMAPVQALIQQLDQGLSVLSPPVQSAQLAPELNLDEDLVALVDELVAALLRHSLAMEDLNR